MKNKVLFLGLLSAVAVAITPFVQTGDVGDIVKWSTVGFAALIATLSFLGNAWKGQGLTLFGIIGNVMFTAGSLLAQGSSINSKWFVMQLVLQSFIAITLTVQPPPQTEETK